MSNFFNSKVKINKLYPIKLTSRIKSTSDEKTIEEIKEKTKALEAYINSEAYALEGDELVFTLRDLEVTFSALLDEFFETLSNNDKTCFIKRVTYSNISQAELNIFISMKYYDIELEASLRIDIIGKC